jgi:anti-sigma B factor antagonist
MELNRKVIDSGENIQVLSITGRIKSGYLTILDSEFRKLSGGPAVKLILDVQGVDAIDSSGIGELIKGRADITAKGGRVCLLGSNSRVEMMIKISGLDSYFPVASTHEQAIQILNAPPAENISTE